MRQVDHKQVIGLPVAWKLFRRNRRHRDDFELSADQIGKGFSTEWLVARHCNLKFSHPPDPWFANIGVQCKSMPLVRALNWTVT